MANLDTSNPTPAAERALAARAVTEEHPVGKPRAEVIDLAEARRKRNAIARRTWRPKGW